MILFVYLILCLLHVLQTLETFQSLVYWPGQYCSASAVAEMCLDQSQGRSCSSQGGSEWKHVERSVHWEGPEKCTASGMSIQLACG